MNQGRVPESLVVAALFSNRNVAEAAIKDLKEEGFSSDQIAVSFAGSNAHLSDESWNAETDEHRSFWQKVEDFFSGHEPQRKTASTGVSAGPSLAIPTSYQSRIRSGEVLVAVYDTSRLNDAEEILRDHGGSIESSFAEQQRSVGKDVAGDETQRLQLVSEVLRVRKERVPQGEVRLRKEVRTEQQNIQVPVSREELVIERAEGTGSANRGIGTDQEIRVPLSEEQVRVEKQPVVREEVKVGKRRVEEVRNVGDQVRHEELHVENKGDVNVRDKRPGERKKDVA